MNGRLRQEAEECRKIENNKVVNCKRNLSSFATIIFCTPFLGHEMRPKSCLVGTETEAGKKKRTMIRKAVPRGGFLPLTDVQLFSSLSLFVRRRSSYQSLLVPVPRCEKRESIDLFIPFLPSFLRFSDVQTIICLFQGLIWGTVTPLAAPPSEELGNIKYFG